MTYIQYSRRLLCVSVPRYLATMNTKKNLEQFKMLIINFDYQFVHFDLVDQAPSTVEVEYKFSGVTTGKLFISTWK